jgi:DNA polymerase-3 subunit beta
MATSVFNTTDFRATVAEVCDPGMYGANVRLTLRNGAIELMATDGIAGIRRRVEGAVAQEVAVHLPAAVLRSVVDALPADEIQLEFGQSAKIFSGSASFELSVLAEELPDWEEGTPSLSLDGPLLAQGLRAVEYAALRGSHNAFSGICLDLDGETLTLAATDGWRLALYRLNGVRHEPLQRTIRLQDAKKLSRIAKRGGSVALSFEESRVLATTDRTSFVCRVLDGRFPDYRRVIPGTFLGEFVPDAGALVQALKRVALTANDTNRKVSLHVDDDGLTLSATNDVGASTERVAVKSFSGDPLETALNAQLLREAVVKAGGAVRFRFIPTQARDSVAAEAPIMVETMEAPSYQALLMPLREAEKQ